MGPHFADTSELRPPQNKDHFPAVQKLQINNTFTCTCIDVVFGLSQVK